MRILFATPEIAPWAKSGGLGDVSAALPAALRAEGADVRVLIPGYPAVLAAHPAAVTVAVLPAFNATFPSARLLAAQATGSRDNSLFILCFSDYYERPGSAYQDLTGSDWADNDLRFGLLSRAAAWLAGSDSSLKWRPDILHCHDWPLGLAPVYLRDEPGAAQSVMTLHNVAFQGLFPADRLQQLGLPSDIFNIMGAEFYGQLSFLKAGIVYADRVTTVSPGYAREIQTDELGCGLGGVLRHKAGGVGAIINGIDEAEWNPRTDTLLAANYDADQLAGKSVNKAALQRAFRLPEDAALPVLGVVSRLTTQKGMDLLAECIPALVELPAQVVVLGTGEKAIEAQFTTLAARFPGKMAVVIGFDEKLAHQVEAGADLFIMPSHFEPCGLNQMYSMRYGTPPVARATGGLADTIVDLNAETLSQGVATGFLFDDANADALLAAVQRGVFARQDKDAWMRLQQAGMKRDFSWRRSAREYLELFLEVVHQRQYARSAGAPATPSP